MFSGKKEYSAWEFNSLPQPSVGGAGASWLVRSTTERAVWFEPWPGSVLCSWARHVTLTVPLSTQVYKWVPAICWGNLTKLWGSDLRWTSIPSRGSRNTSSRFMLQKQDKLRQLSLIFNEFTPKNSNNYTRSLKAKYACK